MISSRLPAVVCVAAVAMLAPHALRAQAVPVASTVRWHDGFVLESANNEFHVQLNGLLQSDDRWVVEAPANKGVNTFAFRRIRPVVQGSVAHRVDFYFNPDFAGPGVNIRDAYIETRLSPALRVRLGKGKEPFGLERLQSALYLTFVERALPTAVAPDRGIGVQVLGDISGSVLSYDAGVFNGRSNGPAGTDTVGSMDVAARLVLRPFMRNSKGPLAGLGFALAGSSGRQPAVLSSFKTSGMHRFFSYDGAARGQGARGRVSPQYFYYYKSIGAFGEYVRAQGEVTNGSTSEDIAHEALSIAGAVVITGEAASDYGVKPRHPFDPRKHTWGALQVAARYHALRIDPRAITLGFAASGSSREAKSFTIGANWYLNPYFKWVFNFERTVFEGDSNGGGFAENALLLRNQLSF